MQKRGAPKKNAVPAIAKVKLPAIRQVRGEVRSNVAKIFFSSRKYSSKARTLIEAFNVNPKSIFPYWKSSLRDFIQAVQQLSAKQGLTKQEMARLADTAFNEYCPNALVESIKSMHPTFSVAYPSLYIGIHEEGRTKFVSGNMGAYYKYLEPLARELVGSANGAGQFNAAIERALVGETKAHGEIRLLYNPETENHYYRDLLFKKIDFYQRLQAMDKTDAKKTREHELLDRQLSLINEAHGAMAMYFAPTLNRLCDEFITRNKIKGIDPQLWPWAKLAMLGKILSK